MFDWRQLRRFGLSESALPPGSIVKFAVQLPLGALPTMDCRRHRISYCVEAVFIGYLLVQRSRRRRAESLLSYELRFESLVSEFVGHIRNVPTEQTDAEIEKALEKLREFLDLDRVSLFESTDREATIWTKLFR